MLRIVGAYTIVRDKNILPLVALISADATSGGNNEAVLWNGYAIP